MYLPQRISCMRMRKETKGKVITRKPVIPSQEELEENSRAKSSKLRVFEREIQ